MNISQHQYQKELTKKRHEQQTYLHNLKDGELLYLYRSLVGDLEIARYVHHLERAQQTRQDLDLVKLEIHNRMAERRTVRDYIT